MPIYLYSCVKCGAELELIQGIDDKSPLCCGEPMKKKPTFPAIVKVKGMGGVKTLSKGYKEGYAKDYQKDVPPFEPTSFLR